VALAVEQTTKREHMNIERTNNLEHGQPQILPVDRCNSESEIVLRRRQVAVPGPSTDPYLTR
jgi:hypothetical protein